MISSRIRIHNIFSRIRNYVIFLPQAKHLGVVYTCDECDYSTNMKPELRKHKRTEHEGVRCRVARWYLNYKLHVILSSNFIQIIDFQYFFSDKNNFMCMFIWIGVFRVFFLSIMCHLWCFLLNSWVVWIWYWNFRKVVTLKRIRQPWSGFRVTSAITRRSGQPS